MENPSTCEQQNLLIVPSFLAYITQIPSMRIRLDVSGNRIIFSDPSLSKQERINLFKLILWLTKDSDDFFLGVNAGGDLPNQDLGQTGNLYREAIMAAYAMYRGKFLTIVPKKSTER